MLSMSLSMYQIFLRLHEGKTGRKAYLYRVFQMFILELIASVLRRSSNAQQEVRKVMGAKAGQHPVMPRGGRRGSLASVPEPLLTGASSPSSFSGTGNR